MKKSHKIRIISMFILVILFSGCDFPNILEMKPSNNKEIYAGEGELCKNYMLDMNCSEGLVCTEVTTKPKVIAYCYPEGHVLDQDMTYREVYENNVTLERHKGQNVTFN